MGFIFPGILPEGDGEVLTLVDFSCSINSQQFGLFEAEVRSILDGRDRCQFMSCTSSGPDLRSIACRSHHREAYCLR